MNNQSQSTTSPHWSFSRLIMTKYSTHKGCLWIIILWLHLKMKVLDDNVECEMMFHLGNINGKLIEPYVTLKLGKCIEGLLP